MNEIDKIRQKFDRFVVKNPDGCWSSRRVRRVGYWPMTIGYRTKMLAHRVSWLIHNGPIPEGLFVCHHCDNPHCTRPDHLFLGTAADNTRDMLSKGRHSSQRNSSRFNPIKSIRKTIWWREYDLALIKDLKKHGRLTFTDVVRKAVQLLHEKEIQSMTKTILVVILCIAACSCGAQVVLPQDGGGGPDPTPTPTPVATPTPNPNFVPPQPLTCTGDILVGGGQQCTFSDGVSFYRADQFSEAIGADGHGTFQIISEEGFNGTALHQVTFTFPVPIHLLEIHGTGSIDSWCNNNGVVTTWDSNAPDGTIGHIVGGKNFFFNSGDTVSYVIPQTVFPAPIPIAALTQNVFVDLCAGSTVHWVLYGSF